MLEKCLLTVLELIWNQRLGHKKTKLNICHHMLTSSTQLQNRSFHVVERTRTSTKCQKNEKCTCKACKNTVFHCQICKFVGFLFPYYYYITLVCCVPHLFLVSFFSLLVCSTSDENFLPSCYCWPYSCFLTCARDWRDKPISTVIKLW